MLRQSTRPLLAAPIMATAMLVAATAAHAQTTVKGGSITITPGASFVEAIAKIDVTAKADSPAKIEGEAIEFPVTSGWFTLSNGKGQLSDSGGLTLSHGKYWVKVSNFVVKTVGHSGTLSADVWFDGKLEGRVTMFDLAIPQSYKEPYKTSGGALKLSGVKLTVDTAGAKKLN